MLRILRAFAWMRWRVMVNSLERTGARDTLERFSIAMEQIAPMIALALLVPSAVASGALGIAAGYALATADAPPVLLQVCRFLLLAAVAVSILGPLAMPSGERTNAVRLSLLPISRPTLYVAQTASALADPWVLLAIPLTCLLPAGLAAGGAFGRAAAALAAGLLLVAILVGLTSLVTSLLHIVVRDRRRGELAALFFILVLPMVGLLPALLTAAHEEDASQPARGARESPAWVQAARHAAPYIPSESYVSAVAGPATGVTGRPASPIAALAAGAIVLHALGLVLYGHLLASPGSTGASRRGARRRLSLRIPGVSPGTSALALGQLRLAARTPRGRSILLSPLIVVLMFGALMYRGAGDMQLGFIVLESGLGLATFGAVASLLAVLPIAMNQFGVDRAGLTLVLLSPLSDGELLAGKAIGNGLIIVGPVLLCTAGAFVAFPGGSPWLWISIPVGVLAAYVLAAPAAAALSAIFPRAVDMNSISRGSNAHAAAGLLGLLAFLAAGGPCAILVIVATRLLGQPAAAVVFLLVWLGLSIALAAALFVPVRKLFARRRENLAMIG